MTNLEDIFYNDDNWENMKYFLDKNCKPFIKELKGARHLLLRGVNKSDYPVFMDIKTIRRYRKPRIIDTGLHDKLGKTSKEIYGWNIRKDGLFTTKSEEDASIYGPPAIIFPIGKFKYVWNDNVDTLYEMYDKWDNKDVYNDIIIPELKKYHTTNLNAYLKSPPLHTSECIIYGKNYYIINDVWKKKLLNHYSG
jgi:hypothetical protein